MVSRLNSPPQQVYSNSKDILPINSFFLEGTLHKKFPWIDIIVGNGFLSTTLQLETSRPTQASIHGKKEHNDNG